MTDIIRDVAAFTSIVMFVASFSLIMMAKNFIPIYTCRFHV